MLRVALAPLGWIDGNFKAAKDEHNVVTQVFRAVTGISAKDIAKFGPLGGPNSELRKLANAIAGGENSEVRKGLRFSTPETGMASSADPTAFSESRSAKQRARCGAQSPRNAPSPPTRPVMDSRRFTSNIGASSPRL